MRIMSVYDFGCAELILEYVSDNYSVWCQVAKSRDITALEFVLDNIKDFQAWAKSRNFIVTLDRES